MTAKETKKDIPVPIDPFQESVGNQDGGSVLCSKEHIPDYRKKSGSGRCHINRTLAPQWLYTINPNKP